MCQATCGPCLVGCAKCGASFYEDAAHTCLVRVPFKVWLKDLRARAAEPLPVNPLFRTMREATRAMSRWPVWKLRYVWADEFRHSVEA
jgi:hypothetical protein